MTFESKYSEESKGHFFDEFHMGKKEKCGCHKKVLSHHHNPCFDHKHGHHHDKCSCNHKGHCHVCNPCLDHKHGHHHGHGNHHSSCFSGHHGHGHCDDFFFMDHCCGPKAFSHNNCCNKHFSLHLAGLTGDLNFQFFRKKGCCAKVDFECASETNSITGRVCAIGIDFVDILKNDKTVVTIMKQRICSIHWLDKCDHHGYMPPCDVNDAEEEEVVETDASIKPNDTLEAE